MWAREIDLVDIQKARVGRIGTDQVEDYARRKGMSVPEVERRPAPNVE